MPLAPPSSPQIFHIVHHDRLASIIASQGLFCDSVIKQHSVAGSTIGMGGIKDDRLALPVHCHAGTNVGDYVPFYFCPRSVMLFLLHKGNHPNLAYKGGQGPIVHLEASFNEAVAWAEQQGRRWAFTASNAAARYTQFYNDRGELGRINWDAVVSNQWRDSAIKEGKQAEFLVHHSFPWTLFRRIGVSSQGVYSQVASIISQAAHKPRIEIKQDWYY